MKEEAFESFRRLCQRDPASAVELLRRSIPSGDGLPLLKDYSSLRLLRSARGDSSLRMVVQETVLLIAKREDRLSALITSEYDWMELVEVFELLTDDFDALTPAVGRWLTSLEQRTVRNAIYRLLESDLSRPDRAERLLERYIRALRKQGETYDLQRARSMLARVMERQGRQVEAVRLWERLRGTGHRDKEIADRLSLYYGRVGRLTDAITVLEERDRVDYARVEIKLTKRLVRYRERVDRAEGRLPAKKRHKKRGPQLKQSPKKNLPDAPFGTPRSAGRGTCLLCGRGKETMHAHKKYCGRCLSG